jgi:hypothetical protein
MAGITAVVMGVRAMGPFTGPYIGRVTGRGIGQVTGRGIVRAMVAAAGIGRATVVAAADIVPVAAAVAVIAEVTAAAVASGKYFTLLGPRAFRPQAAGWKPAVPAQALAKPRLLH